MDLCALCVCMFVWYVRAFLGYVNFRCRRTWMGAKVQMNADVLMI